MKVSYLPVLGVLRDLYAQPRDMRRFREYVARLTGGGDDVLLPIGVANPMAREHALARVDELLALGAERMGAEASRAAERRLSAVQTVEIKAAIVLADDLGGGWTNRYTTDAMVRFPARGALKRPFATALVWTSESVSIEQLRREVLAAIYRVAYQQTLGLRSSLAQRLEQEGLAGQFAGIAPRLTPEAIDRAQKRIELVGADPPYPTVFAALYGDEAARELGYSPLGLPAWAGFDVALRQARGRDPVQALLANAQARRR